VVETTGIHVTLIVIISVVLSFFISHDRSPFLCGCCFRLKMTSHQDVRNNQGVIWYEQ
jgi:hypothetical protein